MKSKGKCLFCSKTFTKAGINRHLTAHLKEKEAGDASEKSFLVMVEPAKKMDDLPYFLSLWIDGETEFDRFDRFLRKIWLECCHHRSDFRKKQKPLSQRPEMDTLYNLTLDDFVEMNRAIRSLAEYHAEGEISIYNKAKCVFRKDMVLDYNYDFGSTTSLTIKVVDEYPFKADTEIVLLSRNEPLEIMCRECKIVPATKLCVNHWNFSVFCDDCAKKHAETCSAYTEYTSRQLVNSPRTGECVYNGGSIDKERDGVYQL